MSKPLRIALATFVTSVALVVTMVAAQMAAASAANRGGTELDKELLVSLSVVMVLAVHLIPAISRNWVSWLVWFGCLVCALFSHLTFFTHADLRANDNLALASARTIGIEQQIKMTREALGQIVARPVALVADELAKSSDKRERAALTVEIAQGKKAEMLRDRLIKLSEVSTELKVGGAVNPVFMNLQEVFGWNVEKISLAIYLFNAICLELFGALIWFLAFKRIHGVSAKGAGAFIENSLVVSVAEKQLVSIATRVTNSIKNGMSGILIKIRKPMNTDVPDSTVFDVPARTGNVMESVPENVTDDVTRNVPDRSCNVNENETRNTPGASRDVTENVTRNTPFLVPVTQKTGAGNEKSKVPAHEFAEEIAEVVRAAKLGICKLTVRGIREYLDKCGSDKASTIAREAKLILKSESIQVAA